LEILKSKTMKLKDFLFILIVLCTIPQFGCQKEPANNTPVQAPIIDTTYSRDLGWISYDYNGVFEQQQQHAYYDIDNTISSFWISYGNPLFGLYEQITFNNLILKEGLMELEHRGAIERRPTAIAGLILEGDQFLQSWLVDTTGYNSYVEFTRIDSTLQRMKGTFQVRLIKREPDPPPFGYPDTIELTNGRFYLEYEVI